MKGRFTVTKILDKAYAGGFIDSRGTKVLRECYQSLAWLTPKLIPMDVRADAQRLLRFGFRVELEF